MSSESKETTFLPHALVSSVSQNEYKVALEQDVFGSVFADKDNDIVLQRPYIDNFIMLDLGYHGDELIHTLREDIVTQKLSSYRDYSGFIPPEHLLKYYSCSGAFFVYFRKNNSAIDTIMRVVKKGSTFLGKIAKNQWKMEKMLIKKGLPIETVRKKFKNFSREEFLLMINYFILSRIIMVGQTKSGQVIIGRWIAPERLREQMTSIHAVFEMLKEQETEKPYLRDPANVQA
jgi:hypothetical protein